jgi:hypothetical protein
VSREQAAALVRIPPVPYTTRRAIRLDAARKHSGVPEGITRFDALPAVRSLKFPEAVARGRFPGTSGGASVSPIPPRGGTNLAQLPASRPVF